MSSSCACQPESACTRSTATPTTKTAEAHSLACRKCGPSANAYIILDRVHAECRECFLESCNKKIRSTIGRSRRVRNKDPILLAFSGGQSSAAMLDLIKNSMHSDRVSRDQKFKPSIVHIDTQILVHECSSGGGDSEAQISQRINNLAELLRHTRNTYPDWPLYWTTLESCLVEPGLGQTYFEYDHNDLNDSKYDSLLKNADLSAKFALSLAQRTDFTDKIQYADESVARLLDAVAVHLNSKQPLEADRFKYVFTANNATRLANELLVNVILGLGATINSAVSVCDERSSVARLRALRDFSHKEVALYLRARNVISYTRPGLTTFADRKSSIQTVTESFLSKLSVDYPSTCPTLLKTANKMQEALALPAGEDSQPLA